MTINALFLRIKHYILTFYFEYLIICHMQSIL
nr:MAG TPA: hypothetical protein [Caudoviricetes sp.]